MFTAQYLGRLQLFQWQIIALAVVGLIGYACKRFCKKNRLLQRVSPWLITLGKGVIVAIPVTLFQDMTRQSWLIITLIGIALIANNFLKGKQEMLIAIQSSVDWARKEGASEGFMHFMILAASLLAAVSLAGSWIWSASYAVNHQSILVGALLFMVAKIVLIPIAMLILGVIVMIAVPFLVRRDNSVATKSVKREPTAEELAEQEHAKARMRALQNIAHAHGVHLALRYDMQNRGHFVVCSTSSEDEGRYKVAYLYPGQLRDLYDDPAPEGVESYLKGWVSEIKENDGIWSDEEFRMHHGALLNAARKLNLKLVANGD